MREFPARQGKGGSVGHAKMDLWWGKEPEGAGGGKMPSGATTRSV